MNRIWIGIDGKLKGIKDIKRNEKETIMEERRNEKKRIYRGL